MQLVIDIDEYDYEKVKELVSDGVFDYNGTTAHLFKSVVSGTPLPKGHGRLIDADEFHHTLEDMTIRDTDKWFNWLQKACNRLANAQTIIEADKETEE